MKKDDRRPGNERGFRCPACGRAVFRVIYTRPSWGGESFGAANVGTADGESRA